MHSTDHEQGIFTPEELRQMSEELRQRDVPGEPTEDRELRALKILSRTNAMKKSSSGSPSATS